DLERAELEAVLYGHAGAISLAGLRGSPGSEAARFLQYCSLAGPHGYLRPGLVGEVLAGWWGGLRGRHRLPPIRDAQTTRGYAGLDRSSQRDYAEVRHQL